jgi:uncharacterized membrane protein
MIGSSLGAIHFTAAIAALACGAIVLGAPKGTPLHRTIGAGYVAAMVILNVSALLVYRLTGRFEPFHALALISLATVVCGIVPALRRRPGWLMAHYSCMAWSYLGLLAAACSEIVVRLFLRAGILTGRRRYRDCDFVRCRRDGRIAAPATNRIGLHGPVIALLTTWPRHARHLRGTERYRRARMRSAAAAQTRFMKAELSNPIGRESAICGDLARSSRFHSSTMIHDGILRPIRCASVSGIASAVRSARGG